MQVVLRYRQLKILFAPGIGVHREFPLHRQVFGDDLEIINFTDCHSLSDHLQRIDSYARVLEEEKEDYIVMGHSFGANLLYRYTAENDLDHLKATILTGAGARFHPLTSWNFIFNNGLWFLYFIVFILISGTPFMFLLYGWNGMIQRLDTINLFRYMGIANLKKVYNNSLEPLANDPPTYRWSTPVLSIRLPKDLLFPQYIIDETKELITNFHEKIIPRDLIHLTHHLDPLVLGYSLEWLIKEEIIEPIILPQDIEMSLKNPKSVEVQFEQWEPSRIPLMILLFFMITNTIELIFPSWAYIQSINTIPDQILIQMGFEDIPPFVVVVAITIAVLYVVAYQWVLIPSIPRARMATLYEYPKISIIVPMRNESRNIERCVISLLNLQYPDYEIILVDGQSTDDTIDKANKTLETHNPSRIPSKIIVEPDLPQGWVGKSWGCWNGIQHTNGEYFLFTDADTEHSPTSLRKSMQIMLDKELDGISIIGQIETHSFWERAVMPFFKSLLFFIFGGRFSTKVKSRTLAIGQYILVKTEVYKEFGGHKEIRDKVAEDIHLSHSIRRVGNFQSFNDNNAYQVRMYQSLKEIRQGLGRNAYESIGSNRLTAIVASLGLLIWKIGLLLLYPIALIFAFEGPWVMLLLFILMLVTLGEYWVDIRTNSSSPWLAFLVPLGIMVVIYVLVSSTFSKRKHTVVWKDRSYSV